MRRKRRLRMLFWWSLGAFVLFVLLCNRWVINSTDAYLYTNSALLPENDVGLVLGTSSYTREGEANPQFYGRVDAAVQLYRQGKVKHLIVSGANPDSTYNEPRRMWQELTKAGIPAKDITMDFAGFRTLDSLARAKEVFNLSRVTLITQRYHAYRAIFLGKKMGMRVVAFVAPANASGEFGNRSPPREVFARVKAVLDLFVLSTKPRFLGQPEPIEVPAPEDGYMPAPREAS
ncbi:MAG: SanA/YdcF family protein [Panacagrimonas sp.]